MSCFLEKNHRRSRCSSRTSFGEALAASDVTETFMNYFSNLASLAKRIESAGACMKN
jgi:hypothetical protein